MMRTILTFLCLLVIAQTRAELSLPHIISDNMMLQRDAPARVRGWGTPGATVTVEFAGQEKSATADPTGGWLVTLDPMPASAESRTMTITKGEERKTIQNILVGEVWQAAGQSNMQWSVMAESHWAEAEQYPANDQIRLFKQERNPQGTPAGDTLNSAWVADETKFSRRHFSAVAYYFARNLQQELGIPVGISLASEGGTKCQYWTPIEAFKGKPEYEEWLDEAIRVQDSFEQIRNQFEADKAEYFRKREAGEKVGAHPGHYGRQPCYYYNGMIHPIRHYTIRGTIWYQGERNSMTTKDAFEYRTYFPLMIESWRAAFHHPDMPFYFVQLPKMGERDIRDSKVTRESQMLTARTLKNANMVVTLDVGEPGLHPKTKRPIGERLAKMALAEVYGKEVDYQFPLYLNSEVNGSSLVIEFEHVGEGLMSNDGQPLREFTICGADQKFVSAKAEIVGKTVVVSSPGVSSPVAVRYAWKGTPMVNLFGKNGLPVGPFRTDQFELESK